MIVTKVFAITDINQTVVAAPTVREMAMSVPIVASDVGGVPKIIAYGSNGLLVSPTSIEDLKNKIIELYESKCLRKKLVDSAFVVVSKKYDIESCCRKIEYTYGSRDL